MPIALVRNQAQAAQSLASLLEHGTYDEFILVVPTKRRIRYLTRELLTRNATIVPEPPIFTLELLATKILETAFPQLRLAEESIQTLLFGQAIDMSRDALMYFYVRGRYDTLPRGTLDKVIHVIKKLKEVGIYPGQLADELAEDEEDDQPKLRDIVTIYSAYEESLAKLESVDVEGIFKWLFYDCAQKDFEAAFRRFFPKVQTVSIVGFDEFTEPELGVIQKLSSMNLEVSLLFDYLPGNESLFGHLSENYNRFLGMGFSERTDPVQGDNILLRSRRSERTEKTVQHIAKNLFRRDGSTGKLNCSDQITILKARDRLVEVEAICKLIKQLITDRPELDLSRVCVAMYKPGAYTHIMREQFKKYGIPVNITDRFELSQSPVVGAVVGLLDMAIRNFRREDVLRCIGSSYFRFDEDGERVDAANLMNIARELRITAGPRSWMAKIDREVQKLRNDIALSTDDEENERRERRVNAFEKASRDIQWLESLLSGLSSDLTPAQFERQFLFLMERVDVPRRIISGGTLHHSGILEQDARAYAKLLDVVGQVVQLLEYQDGKEVRHPLRFYVEQIRVAASQERYNVRERFGQGVLVTSIDETRGLPIDVMILAGLVDGEFPSVYQSELFFGKRRMKEREQRHSWENRYLFYQAITNWSEHLYLTYPEQDAELDLVRSGFVDALLNIAEVEHWMSPGSTPFEETFYSVEDLLRYRGSVLLADRSADVELIPDGLRAHVEHMTKALRVETSRIDEHNLPEYEGLIANHISEEAKEKLLQLKHRVYSVSQLETYGKCPYQFFAQRLLRLNVIEEVEEEFSALDKGSVLHDILFEFYSERREKNLPALVGCSDADFAAAHRQLLNIAERKLSAMDIPDAFWDLEKELILGDKHTGRGILREFLEYERKRASSMRPGFFEVGFGSKLGSHTRIDTTFSSEEPVVAGDVLLRGKVDRVEVGESEFAIIDYKTGKDLPKFEDLRSGLSLQLPIYLYTIERMLEEKLGREMRPAGGVYYQLRSPVALKVGVGNEHYKRDFEVARSNANLLPSEEDLRHLINESILFVNSYVDEMTQGKFPLTSYEKIDKVCTFCDYKTVCRIQSMRRVEKEKPEVS